MRGVPCAHVKQRRANADASPFEEIAKRPTFSEPGLVTNTVWPQTVEPATVRRPLRLAVNRRWAAPMASPDPSKFKTTHPEREVESCLALYRQRLQYNGAFGAADQYVGTGSDASRDAAARS